MFAAFARPALNCAAWMRLLWAAVLGAAMLVLSGCALWQSRGDGGHGNQDVLVSQVEDAKAKSASWGGDEEPSADDAPDDNGDDDEAGIEAEATVIEAAGFELQIYAARKIRAFLAQHLDLQNYRELNDLRPAELNRLLAAAPANIGELLATLGHFQPHIAIQVHYPEKNQSDQHDGATVQRPQVIVSVEAGPQARVQTVDIEVQGAAMRHAESSHQINELRNAWSLEAGQPFTQSGWQQAKNEALARLQAQRYPTASVAHSSADVVVPPPEVDAQNPERDSAPASARLGLSLDSGPLYRLGPLVIEGAERYNPSGAVRLADLPVGQDYSQEVLLDTQQRLMASGLYDSVFLTLDTASASEGSDVVQVPVVAQVREAPLKKWIYGLGYSTDAGPRFSLEHTHNRVTDLQWRSLTKLQINRKNPLLAWSAHNLPDHTGWNWFAGAQIAREELASYQLNTFNARAGRSRNERKIDRTWTLHYEWNGPRGKERNMPDVPPTSASLMASYGWTGRYFNNPYLPTKGWGFAWEAGLGTTLRPTREVFTRVMARTLHIIPVGKAGRETKRRSRIALRASAGAVTARKEAAIPPTQLFVSGGDTTVRGYAYQSIGARSNMGRVVGGHYMATASIEWQRPIVLAGNRRDWEHTVFIDAGAVQDKAADVFKRDNLYTSVGAGIRWNSPVGPLQADLAWGVKTRKPRLHLRLGFNF